MQFADKEFKIKGGQSSKFKRPTIWDIENEILYGILYSRDIPLSEVAKSIGVNIRSVEAWCFEGRIPNKENIEAITDFLGYPREILFHDAK